ncbi:MAG: hypothetical protein K9H65_03775 [Bacteroidales bacterium]|nr:hypothetical protein [Bacteroidales bacterium]
MENNELQKIWRRVDSEINQKSRDELNLLLMSKTKQTLNKFLVITSISIMVCLGLLIFLTITSLNRQNDLIYLINNATLGIVVFISLYYGLSTWYKLKNNRYNQPLKVWLEEKIDLLSKWLTGRFRNLEFYLFPLLYILTILSIHIYYTELNFMEVFKSEKFLNEDMWGMIFFTPIILAGGFYGLIKTRKYYLKTLEFLKDLHGRLCNVR